MSEQPEAEISTEKLRLLLGGAFRDGELTVGEAVAAYEVTDISMGRAAESCGISRRDMAKALDLYYVKPDIGPETLEELHENDDTQEEN